MNKMIVPTLLVLHLAGGCSPGQEQTDNNRLENKVFVAKIMKDESAQMRKASQALNEQLIKLEEMHKKSSEAR